MIDAIARAVLNNLQRHDALEREQGVPRRQRLRQVAPDVGCFLHTLVLATAARSVDATVTTLEIDPVKVQRATSNLREAGVDHAATIVEADAFDYLRDRRKPIDFVFLDAEKEDYLRLLELIVPLLPVGDLLVADNLISHAEELSQFRQRCESHPHLSAVAVPIGRGELFSC